MNTKVSANEISLENINIQARPMKIAEEYSLFLSNAWLDAKSALDEIDSLENMEPQKVQILCDIILVSISMF